MVGCPDRSPQRSGAICDVDVSNGWAVSTKYPRLGSAPLKETINPFPSLSCTTRTTRCGPTVVTGCPVTTVGPQRVVLVVQDRLGKGLIVSFSGADPSLGYFVETAHPFDTSTSQIAPLRCGDRSGQPTIVSQTESVPGQVNLRLRFQPPLVYSDCDAGSVGISLGTTCTDSFQ